LTRATALVVGNEMNSLNWRTRLIEKNAEKLLHLNSITVDCQMDEGAKEQQALQIEKSFARIFY
jgi:hypothetical protein